MVQQVVFFPNQASMGILAGVQWHKRPQWTQWHHRT